MAEMTLDQIKEVIRTESSATFKKMWAEMDAKEKAKVVKEVKEKADLSDSELLKKLKAREVKKEVKQNGQGEFKCTSCGYFMSQDFSTCPKCSVELEWPEE